MIRRLDIRKLLSALAIALALVVADYLTANFSFPIFDTSDTLSPYAFIFGGRRYDDSDKMAVNVACDRQLAPKRDVFGDTLGLVDVTARRPLMRLLRIAAGANYRYILMDIRFEAGLECPEDSALFALLDSLPRLVIPTHRESADFTPAEGLPADKLAYGDFRCKRQSGFSRYEFLQEGHESMALRMYHELDGGSVQGSGLLYADGSWPCTNTQFVDIPFEATQHYGADGEVQLPYLSSQVLAHHSDEDLRRMMDGKVLIIGDFDNDTHGSYIGDIPGPLIHYYAFKLLERGGHRLNLWLAAFMLVLFTAIAYGLLTGRGIRLKRVGNPWVEFLISFIGWEAVLWAIKVALYLLWGLSFSALLPGFVFSSISFFYRLKHNISGYA